MAKRVWAGCALAVVVVMSAGGPAGAQKGAKKKVRVMQDATLIAELQTVHFNLGLANPAYKGHLAKARKHISDAIGELDKGVPGQAGRPGTPAKPKAPKRLSDAQVNFAGKQLQTIRAQLLNLPPTAHRTAAARHINQAFREVFLALKVKK